MNLRRSLFAALLLVLLVSSLSFAACPTASRTINLAAVTGEDSGGVFQLVVDVHPGTGRVYTDVSPRTGITTQESEDMAVNWAFSAAGMDRSECDVLFHINGNFGDNSVDGPSAGGAMTVATHAALIGAQIRSDVVMTGTIAKAGGIGPIGGVIEKGIAASDAGAKYFLAPKLAVYQSFLLTSISRQKDFTTIEISNVSDAEEVLFSNYSDTFPSRFNPQSTPLPAGLQVVPQDALTMRFSAVATAVVDKLQAKVSALFTGGNQTEQAVKLQKYFSEEISNYRTLIALGYPFTAANAAFQLSIDAEYVKIGDMQVDLDGSIQDVGNCVFALSAPKKNSNNFDWAVGADLRRIWAQKKLNETIENRGLQGGYTTLRDLLYSYSWCGISKQLNDEANSIGGPAVDESRLAPLASQKLLEAQDVLATAPQPDYDAIWHFDSGMMANQSGEYGAAIYEAVYAKTMQQATSSGDGNTSSMAGKLTSNDRTTLWGRTYYSHGMFLYQSALADNSSFSDAYRILKYSSELDKADAQIALALSTQSPQTIVVGVTRPQPAPGPTEQDVWVSLFLGLSIVAFGIAIIYRLVKRGTRLVPKNLS